MEQIRDPLRQDHAPVLSAGAAHAEHQRGLPLLLIAGNEEAQHIHDLIQKSPGDGKGENVIPNRGFQSRMLLQLRHIEGVGQKADVQHQIRILRDAVFVPEGTHMQVHSAAGAVPAEFLHQALAQPGQGIIRGVHHHVRQVLQPGHAFPLQRHGGPEVFSPGIQGMPVAGLLVSQQDSLRPGFQEQDPEGSPFPRVLNGLPKPAAAIHAPDIAHKGYPVVLFLRCQTQVHEAGDQLRREIIHTVITQILQDGGRLALSAAGKARYQYEFHFTVSLSPVPGRCRNPAAPVPVPRPADAGHPTRWRRRH